MRQTIKARYHEGVLQPLEPLSLADEAEVQVTVETEYGKYRRHSATGGGRLSGPHP